MIVPVELSGFLKVTVDGTEQKAKVVQAWLNDNGEWPHSRVCWALVMLRDGQLVEVPLHGARSVLPNES